MLSLLLRLQVSYCSLLIGSHPSDLEPAVAVAEGLQSGSYEPAFEHALVPRDSSCSSLPKLCTDHVLMRGVATTLTYLCPEPTTSPTTTILVTITKTTTVTEARSTGTPAVPAPPKYVIISQAVVFEY